MAGGPSRAAVSRGTPVTTAAPAHHDSEDDAIERLFDELAAEEMLDARWASPIVAPPVPDLVDLYVPEGPAFIWLRWSLRGWDLELVAAGREQVGAEPEWLRHERKYDGFDGIVGRPWLLTAETELRIGGFHIAARRGLAPGQPFLVRIDPPHVYRTSIEYDEWDVDWTWEIVRVVAWTLEQSGRSWAQATTRAAERREQHAQEMMALREKRRTDVTAMYILRDRYWPGGYCEMTPPRGIIARLSTQHGHHWLGDGRDDGGDWEKALAQLVEHARTELPHLVEEQIRALPVRQETT